MSISSRTPEGLPNRCPLCRNSVVIEPSLLFGDAACPHCGHLLWFVTIPAGVRLYARSQADEVRDRVIGRVARRLGVDPSKVTADLRLIAHESGFDSLDVVELVMELEEEFDAIAHEPPEPNDGDARP